MADVSARHLGIPALFVLLAGNFILQQPAPAPAPAPVTAAPLARFTLAQQAEFPVGVVNGDNAPGLALCPDGTLYVGIRGSGLKVFDPAGKLLLTDTAIPLPRYPECYACDAQRRLYTAEHKLSIFEPTADGKLKQISSSSMHAVLQRLLIAPDGTIFGINYEPKNRLSLVIISKEGKYCAPLAITRLLDPTVSPTAREFWCGTPQASASSMTPPAGSISGFST